MISFKFSFAFGDWLKCSFVATSFVPGYSSVVAYRLDAAAEKDLVIFVLLAAATRGAEVEGRKQRRLALSLAIEAAIVIRENKTILMIVTRPHKYAIEA